MSGDEAFRKDQNAAFRGPPHDPVTEIGGPDRRFPSTSWTTILSARGGGAIRPALDRLVARYWKPVYWFIRTRWGRGNEDAKDLSQAFFALFLEQGFLLQYDSARGRFRTFVRAALQHFLCNTVRDAGREKRGGGRPLFNVDMSRESDLEPETKGLSPDEAFDRAWAKELLEDAIASIGETYRAAGREDYFEVFRRLDLAEGEPPTYAQVAVELGIAEHDVQNRLRHVRRAFRELIRARVLETLSDPGDLEAEIDALLHWS